MTDLLVLGAGAKGTAIAVKAHVLNSLGLGSIDVAVVEATGPAAAWCDGNGVTSSREILALSPSKDLGFPYQSERAFPGVGQAIDRAMTAFSWQRYLIEEGRYADWLDAGSPPVQRRAYGAYLAWALARATDGVRFVDGRVARIARSPDELCWVVDVATPSGPRRMRCRAFALTGQGVHRTIPHEVEAAPRVLDCESGRMEIACAPVAGSSDIAIVGGGESALSCVEFVRALRPDARLTVYTAALPMSRVESFLENRVFSRPDEVGWTSLDVDVRRDFILRSDRGVFGAERVAPFAYDEHCRFVCGRVTHVASARDGARIRVDYLAGAGAGSDEHDFLINSTGFDLRQQIRALMEPETMTHLEACAPALAQDASAQELAIGRALELEGVRPYLHVPGLAAVSQGPGFSTLGALGLIGDRILEPSFEPLHRARERDQDGLKAPASSS